MYKFPLLTFFFVHCVFCVLWSQQIKIQSGHPTPPFSLAYDSRCDCYAAGYHDQIRVFDRRTHVELITLSGQRGEIRGLQFSPDGKYLLSSGGSVLVLWKTDSWKEVWFGYTPAILDGEAYQFSPDSNFLAYGQAAPEKNKTNLQILDLTSMQETTLFSTYGIFDALAFDNDVNRLFYVRANKSIFSSYKDTTVAFVDLSTKQRLEFKKNPRLSRQIHYIGFDADDNLIVAGEDLVIWNTLKNQELFRYANVSSDGIKLSADKKYLFMHNGIHIKGIDLKKREKINCESKIPNHLIYDYL